MKQSYIPKGYEPKLSLYQTQSAISLIKRLFQDSLSRALHLKRVSAPLFVEPQYDDMAARTLAAETGAPVFVLDPVVTGPVGEEALPWYETTMRQNMATLLEALGNP